MPTLSFPTAVFGYGADDRLQAVGAAIYTNDANGNRTAQTGSNAAVFIHDYQMK